MKTPTTALLAVLLGIALLSPAHRVSRGAEPAAPRRARSRKRHPSNNFYPASNPCRPRTALKTFKVTKGFHVELAAAEPRHRPRRRRLGRGRAAVGVRTVELPRRPQGPATRSAASACWKSTKGDGVYDKSHGLRRRRPLAQRRAAVRRRRLRPLLARPVVLQGHDRQRRGHRRRRIAQKVYTGFQGNTYEIPNTMQWGPDNKIYLCAATPAASVKPADKAGDKDFPAVGGRNFRFDPRAALRGEPCEVVSGGGEWGNTLDDWGERVQLRRHPPVLPPRPAARRTRPQPVHGRVAGRGGLRRRVGEGLPRQPGGAVEGGAAEALVALGEHQPRHEVRPVPRQRTGAARLRHLRRGADGLPRLAPTRRPTATAPSSASRPTTSSPALTLEPNGVGFKPPAGRTRSEKEFIASTDNWFRPVNFANGPDGCLYVISHVPRGDRGRKRDPAATSSSTWTCTAAADRGRIYRVVPDGFKTPKPPRLGKASTAELVEPLKHPDGVVAGGRAAVALPTTGQGGRRTAEKIAARQ